MYHVENAIKIIAILKWNENFGSTNTQKKCGKFLLKEKLHSIYYIVILFPLIC